MLMGGAGLVISPLVLLIMGRSLPLPRDDTSSPQSLLSVLMFLKKPSFLLILLGAAAVAIGGYSMVAFGSAFLMRVHHLQLAQMGRMYGIASGTAGTLGLIIAGLFSDRLSVRDPRWTLWVLALMIAMLVPVAVAAFTVSGAMAALVCLALVQIVNVAYLAPVVLAMQQLVPARSRATASALLLTFNSIAGGLGPLLTGMISDGLHGKLGDLALARALLVVPVTYALAAALFTAATINFTRDMHHE